MTTTALITMSLVILLLSLSLLISVFFREDTCAAQSAIPMSQEQCYASYPISQEQCYASYPATFEQCSASYPISQEQCLANFPISQEQCLANFPISQEQCSANFPISQEQCASGFPSNCSVNASFLSNSCIDSDPSLYILKGNSLRPGDSLKQCEALINDEGTMMLVNRSDGVFVLYDLLSNVRVMGNPLSEQSLAFLITASNTPLILEYTTSGALQIVDNSGNIKFVMLPGQLFASGVFKIEADGNVVLKDSEEGNNILAFGTEFDNSNRRIILPPFASRLD
jgi:hypothetical protein